MKNHVVVVIPGILGSELTYEGPGELMRPVREAVWTGEASVLFKTLTSCPERLHLPRPLKVGDVIRRIRLGPRLAEFSLYDKLINFLEHKLGYRDGEDLFMFAYDWRMSNRESAKTLSEFVRERAPGPTQVSYVAHSMGGLVVRLMLMNDANDDIKARTASFIQMGTPALGSSKAYYTLKKEPSFGSFMQMLLRTSWHLLPETFHALMAALLTFDSLYELLPHETEHILVTVADQHYNALEPRLWSPERSLKLSAVADLQRLVRQFSLPSLVTIYSEDVATDKYYQIDHNFTFQERYGDVKGDGTVSVASAVHGALEERRWPIHERGVRHDDIQNSLWVLSAIGAELEKYGQHGQQ